MSASVPRRLVRRALPRSITRRARQKLEYPRARSEYLIHFSESALRAYRRDLDTFWRDHYGKTISPIDHLKFAVVTGVHDVRLVPHWIWLNEILPHFNDLAMGEAFDDKNLSDRIVPTSASPAITVKRIRGRYYDDRNRSVPRREAWTRIVEATQVGDLIAKPSATNNGDRITGLEQADGRVTIRGTPITLEELEERLGGDYLVQERIVQHPTMSRVHPGSANTLRVVTLRWGDQIRHLGTFARFGTGEAINDNAGTGGVAVGVRDDGQLHTVAVDKAGESLTHHPTTGVAFEGLGVPNWPAIRAFAIALHESVLHLDLVSWDIAIGHDGDPIFLELNFRGASYLYQWVLRRSIFGELTASVLEAVRLSRSHVTKKRPFRPALAGTRFAENQKRSSQAR